VILSRKEFNEVNHLFEQWSEYLKELKIHMTTVVSTEGTPQHVMQPEQQVDFFSRFEGFVANLGFKLCVYDSIIQELFDDLSDERQSEVIEMVKQRIVESLQEREKAAKEQQELLEKQSSKIVTPPEKRLALPPGAKS
jgi:predicted ribosome quality control (RQC) complex YloA/Tae2 family protein